MKLSKVMTLHKISIMALLFMVLSACVTTEEPLFDVKESADVALEKRIEIAIAYLRKGNLELAKKNLFDAEKMSPKSPKVQEVLGLTYMQSAEYELAESSYKKMLHYDKNYTRGRDNYAVFLYRQGRHEESYKQFNRVLEDLYYKKRPQVFVRLALVEVQLEKYTDANEHLRKALQMGVRDTNNYLELAFINYKIGDYAIAHEYWENYRRVIKQVSARALLLGVDIAAEFDDQDAMASNALALKNLYPRSREYLEFKQRYGDSEL